ncbi:MAG: ester cyclase [Actinomycetota bacterium]
MTESKNEQKVSRYWEGFWGDGDRAAVEEFYAPTFRLNGEETVRDEWLEGAEWWRGRFTGIRTDVHKLFTCGDVVVSRVIYKGTHTADFNSLPATGKDIELSGLDVFEFEGGFVMDHWHETDHLEMFRQLGAELRSAEG